MKEKPYGKLHKAEVPFKPELILNHDFGVFNPLVESHDYKTSLKLPKFKKFLTWLSDGNKKNLEKMVRAFFLSMLGRKEYEKQLSMEIEWVESTKQHYEPAYRLTGKYFTILCNNEEHIIEVVPAISQSYAEWTVDNKNALPPVSQLLISNEAGLEYYLNLKQYLKQRYSEGLAVKVGMWEVSGEDWTASIYTTQEGEMKIKVTGFPVIYHQDPIKKSIIAEINEKIVSSFQVITSNTGEPVETLNVLEDLEGLVEFYGNLYALYESHHLYNILENPNTCTICNTREAITYHHITPRRYLEKLGTFQELVMEYGRKEVDKEFTVPLCSKCHNTSIPHIEYAIYQLTEELSKIGAYMNTIDSAILLLAMKYIEKILTHTTDYDKVVRRLTGCSKECLKGKKLRDIRKELKEKWGL